jgi:hypothetical protein
VKNERLQVQSLGSQGQSQVTGVDREISGQDSRGTDKEDEQHEVAPHDSDTRPRPKWYKSTVSDSRHVRSPERSMRQSRPPERFGYMALMTELIDVEPSTYEQATQHGVWQEAMMEEYASTMKNNIWEVVPRPEGKHVWLDPYGYTKSKIRQMEARRSIKRASWPRGFHRKRESIMRRLLPQWPGIRPFE